MQAMEKSNMYRPEGCDHHRFDRGALVFTLVISTNSSNSSVTAQ